MLGANIMWGLMSPIAKIVMATGIVTPLLLTDARIMGAAVLFWFTSLFFPNEHVPPRDLMLLAGAGMLGVLFNQGCFIFGVGFTSPGEASLITTTMPMWVMVLAAIILREPITAKKVGGICLGACGAVILILNSNASRVGGNDPVLGDFLVLTAQLCYALYLTFYRNFIKKYTLVTLMKWMFTFASIALLPISANSLYNTDYTSIVFSQWLGIIYIVGAGTFLAYICIMIGQKNLRPTIVGMYNYVQPVVATAVGIWLGLDRITLLKCCAIILIFAGVWLVTISKAAPADSETQP